MNLVEVENEKLTYFQSTGEEKELYNNERRRVWALGPMVDHTLSIFLKRSLFRELYELHLNNFDIKKPAVLLAHAYSRSRSWKFITDNQAIPVQEWIDTLDGIYPALMMITCNPKNYEVRSKQSLIFHWNQNLSFVQACNSRGVVRLFDPEVGYLDHSRNLRKLINSRRANI